MKKFPSRYNYLYFLFVISGFAGLIYESIWSHYLKLFLGHAAYSQALVLSIFMGGMAMGAWVTGKLLSGKINLLFLYALVELIIGLFGIIFHQIFQVVLDFSFNQIIPMLVNPAFIMIYKWLTGAILILPQSVLLGATFPLMTNGLLRIHPELPGRSIALLYFGNSIGAAIGVLVSGFYLIAKTGIPGTILTAGIINIIIAISVYLIAKNQEQKIHVRTVIDGDAIPYLILAASFITGTASFIYELVWVRMLSMVLGASTHSFELMLSAFITGLAFGGLWIHNRVDRLKEPLRFAAHIQIIMGLLALSTLLLYDQTFDMMGYLFNAVNKNTDGYMLFTLGSHFIALIIMLPTTFLAGMTLPLFTLILLHKGYGEKSISHIYVSNMFGAISGVIFTIFIGFPLLNLKGSMLIGSSLDLMLGFLLLGFSRILTRKVFFTVSCSVFMFLLLSVFTELDPGRMSSSVFRIGRSHQPEDATFPFYQDGKTATITVVRRANSFQTLLTNGKPDASIYMDKESRSVISRDESTQTLLAALPLAIHPAAKRVANIGMGSGLTSHTVLIWPGVQHLDTIEIEAEIINAAQLFRPVVERVFSDPRSHIHIEDAKTFFSFTREKYDLIISEPSNPWVSGVSSLYTQEFYHRIAKSLNDNGYLVQWLHLHEMNIELFYSVLKALVQNFGDFRIYATNETDIVIIARVHGQVAEVNDKIFTVAEMRNVLARLSIDNRQAFQARLLANRRLLEPLFTNRNIQPNSDYFPILDLYAPKARFVRDSVTVLNELKNAPVPVLDFLFEVNKTEHTRVGLSSDYNYSLLAQQAESIYRLVVDNDYSDAYFVTVNPADIDYLVNTGTDCTPGKPQNLWINQLFELAKTTLPYLSLNEMQTIVNRVKMHCAENLFTEIQLGWLDLIDALITKDIRQIITGSDYLLRVSEKLTFEMRDFLYLAQLLGLFFTEDDEAFFAKFSEYTTDLEQAAALPFAMQVLYGQMMVRNSGNATRQ